jgi:FixJ family two-component response regulator
LLYSDSAEFQTLAYTLGAADFVRKPVSCEVFLRALNQQVARSG